MKSRAAVAFEAGQPLKVVEIDVEDPKAGEVMVKITHTGVEIETSCEQGVCGTCMVPVLSGELDHHDAYLSKAERSSGRWIMPCVSRAKSGTLVLDL